MIRFGPSGNSNSFYNEGRKGTIETAKWLFERGLSAFEYSFGRGINLSDELANAIRAEMQKYDIALSVHAPYYINFANEDEETVENSYGYILRSAEKAREMGAKRVVFHPGVQGKLQRKAAVNLIAERMKILTEKIYAAGYDDLYFCPETMGKISQIGDMSEILSLCILDKIYIPTIDFGHLNSRTHGGLKIGADYEKILDECLYVIGRQKTSIVHIHFSKIEYGAAGEIRHLTQADTRFGPEFLPLAREIKRLKLEPIILSESDGTQAEDALEMQSEYNSLKI